MKPRGKPIMVSIIPASQLLPVSQAVFIFFRNGFFLLQTETINPYKENGTLFFSRPNFKPLKAIPDSPSLNKAADNAKENEEAFTFRQVSQGHVPEHVLRRVKEVGHVVPTDVQQQALPILFSGRDCILHAQTVSGMTLAYLLLIFSVTNTQRSAVQAPIVVPTRELGIQVTKVARMLDAKPVENEVEQQSNSLTFIFPSYKFK